jgi:hypothetical protein
LPPRTKEDIKKRLPVSLVMPKYLSANPLKPVPVNCVAVLPANKHRTAVMRMRVLGIYQLNLSALSTTARS